MADQTIITWNAANWITIVLMVAIGFAMIGFITKLINQKKQSAE